jgi:hypothetical protein
MIVLFLVIFFAVLLATTPVVRKGCGYLFLLPLLALINLLASSQTS